MFPKFLIPCCDGLISVEQARFLEDCETVMFVKTLDGMAFANETVFLTEFFDGIIVRIVSAGSISSRFFRS